MSADAFMCALICGLTTVAFLTLSMPARAQCVPGSWTPQSVGTDTGWTAVTYGNGRFVAVGWSGANRAMTSADGIDWTPHAALAGSPWYSVTFGNGTFVAISYSGPNWVMTSPDGENWTARTPAGTNNWQAVTFGNGLFVAVTNHGSNHRIMTSPDGITWTFRSAPGAVGWTSVTFGDGKFVAVGSGGTGDRVMTSTDGINWVGHAAAANNDWKAVTYGNGKFVAVAPYGTNKVMTSPDGENWTAHEAVDETSEWGGIAYGGGLFVATAWNGAGARLMSSTDGENWTAHTVEANVWENIAYGDGTFVAVASDGANRVMASECTGDFCEKFGARDWIDGAYKYCDGAAWQNFSYDGTAGSCAAAGQMEWHDGQAAHTICDGADRQILRWSESSCALTSEMLSIGESIHESGVDPRAFAIYDNGTKAVVHREWNSRYMTFDISGAPSAPTLIATSGAVSGRVDVGEIVVRNGYVFAASPQVSGAGRIWASPLSNVSTSHSYPTSGSVSGNRMCHALGLAMNDVGTVAFVPSWDSAGPSCEYGDSGGSCILNIFDTSDPTAMSAIAHVNLSTLSSNGNIYCNGAYFRDDKLFVSFASGPGNGGMMILDVSNPASPSVLGQAWLSGMGNSQIDHMDVSEDGNLAILGSRAGRVVSVDVSNPSNPTILDSDLFVPISSWIKDVVIVKNYAFIAADPNHIHAVNISDPTDLKLDATISDDMFADLGKMTLLGERIFYTSTGDGRFGILELSCDVENQGPPDLGACSKTAAIDFEPAAPLYKYCDGENWRPMTPDPCVSTAPIQAVTNATGTATDLVRSATLQNTTDGPRFTISLWFKMKSHASNPTTQILFENTAGRIQLGFYSDHPGDPIYDIWVQGKNSSDTLRAKIEAYDIISENVWYHAIASFDTTSGQGRLYINDVEVDYDMRNVASGGQVMDIQSGAYMVHFFGWSGGFEGEIADLWYDDSYVDLSVEANRRKFITGSGAPASLGANGSGPTGAQPLIFFSGDAAQWGTNKGRGGTFAQQGTFQNTTALSSGIAADVGTTCFDGTIFAGLSPDGNVPMFTTPSDEGLFSWNNGTTYWEDTTMANCSGSSPGAEASCVEGSANTALLSGLSDTASPYRAASHCRGLTTGGHKDWYLPAQDELNVLYVNRHAIGGTGPEAWYWSSSEYSAQGARQQYFGDDYTHPLYGPIVSGQQDYDGKDNIVSVRCVRKGQ